MQSANNFPASITERYKVLRTIADGSSAEVKEATELNTQEKVALKVFKVRNPDGKRFWNEIKAMKLISHPAILQFKESYTNIEWTRKNKIPCRCNVLSLQFAENGDLFELISKTGKLPEYASKRLSFQLFSGLEALHGVGIYHRDIKLENLLLDANFNLKIADFGLAKICDSLENEKCYTDCGSKLYMAPEVWYGQPYNGEKYDIWSAGVTCFILYMGYPPFTAAIHSDWWFRRILNLSYEEFWKAHSQKGPTKDISEEAINFLNRCLVADPARRPSASHLLQDSWFSVLEEKSHFEFDQDYFEIMQQL